MIGGASFSPCQKYRYTLSRDWRDLFFKGKSGFVAFCLLNPSTATETEDDPTIRRCIGFAKSWGYGQLAILNLFAIRATDPKVMLKDADPIGPDNDAWIIKTVIESDLVICGWGNHGLHRGRAGEVARLINSKATCKLNRLGDLTEQGCPRHPLYLPAKLKPIPL